ncbi:MAG: transporter substrate-binding domain-containing protein [Acidisphaera sp.]|nr:transporter substrate-binding domain-containing protein [Acidisphaera sp.]
MRRLIALVLAVTVGLAFAGPLFTKQARAQALDRILKEKKVRITAEVTSPPFGFIGQDGQPDGLEIAAARQMAKDLGVELELVQVPATGRIPALLAGRADVAISSLSITLDRAKTVAFAAPHGALSIVVAAPASAAIKSAADLAGKRVALTRATLEEATVPKIAPKGTEFVYFDDIDATIQALLSGQVDAAGMSGFAEKSIADRNPDKHLEPKFTVATAYYAAAVKPGDWDLLHWIDTWVFLHKQDGVLAQIYKKYTGLDLPELPTF